MKQITAKQFLKGEIPPKIIVEIKWDKKDKCFIARTNLQGCNTHGDTLEHALEMAAEAVALWIECVE